MNARLLIASLLVAAPLLLLVPESSWESRRNAMVEEQIVARGVTDERVLEAMRTVPRHEFVPEAHREHAYGDHAIPIGLDQTISQPYIVAFMTEQLDLRSEHTLFELGTGSGYQAAVASRLVDSVYTVEILPELAARAESTLVRLGYDNVHVRAGDGWAGWPEAAPFDRIIVTAATEELPGPLLGQLRRGGKMILPLGERAGVQDLVLVEKSADGVITERELLPVQFVPVTGDH
jgi:protein-L-isoaspartate(D-aspartate) O-methyltransferase